MNLYSNDSSFVSIAYSMFSNPASCAGSECAEIRSLRLSDRFNFCHFVRVIENFSVLNRCEQFVVRRILIKSQLSLSFKDKNSRLAYVYAA
jgi:hypothetical protein